MILSCKLHQGEHLPMLPLSLWLCSLKSVLRSSFPDELPVGSKGGTRQHKHEVQEKRDRVQPNISSSFPKRGSFIMDSNWSWQRNRAGNI